MTPKDIERARELCGCSGCFGGYAIGSNTITAPNKARPTTCLAAVILKDLPAESASLPPITLGQWLDTYRGVISGGVRTRIQQHFDLDQPFTEWAQEMSADKLRSLRNVGQKTSGEIMTLIRVTLQGSEGGQ